MLQAGRGGTRRAGAAQVFIKIAAQVLLGASAFLHTTLISAQQLAPLPGLGVGLPTLIARPLR